MDNADHLSHHYRFTFLEGVYLDRSAQSLKPKFVKLSVPSAADIAAVVAKLSQRVIRKLRKLGYLEPDLDATIVTGYDPLAHDAPELVRTLSASVQPHIAFGERAAHRRDQLERLIRYTARGVVSLERQAQDEGGDLLYTFTQAGSDGATGLQLSPLERLEKLSAWVPPSQVHPVWYAGCLAAHSQLRGVIPPTTRQPGIEAAARPASSRWGWAGLLKRVFAIDMERCPRCPQGASRIIAAITWRRILSHLKLAADLPPLAQARLGQGRFAWTPASPTGDDWVFGPRPRSRCVHSV